MTKEINALGLERTLVLRTPGSEVRAEMTDEMFQPALANNAIGGKDGGPPQTHPFYYLGRCPDIKHNLNKPGLREHYIK